MSVSDNPTEICICPVSKKWVRTEQSKADCFHENKCQVGQICPFEEYFEAHRAVMEKGSYLNALLLAVAH